MSNCTFKDCLEEQISQIIDEHGKETDNRFCVPHLVAYLKTPKNKLYGAIFKSSPETDKLLWDNND